MNNRQKAKHFKKLYEAQLGNVRAPIFPTTKRMIVRVKAKQTVSEIIVNELSADAEPPMAIAGRLLTKQLAEQIIKYAKVTIEPSEIPYHVNLVAELDLVQQEEQK